MNATVENTPKLEDLSKLEQTKTLIQFTSILHRITISGNETALRANMNDLDTKMFQANQPSYFIWGFGGEHMWVLQKGLPNRIIFVPFN